MTIRWAIAGPGRIADVVAPEFELVEDAELVAVASRSADRARAFADRHGIPRAHGSYQALAEDPDVDVVYVATPHPQHKAIALACIAQGKGVLVEKSFTCTPQAAQEVVDAARAARVFCMEAMWTRFQPVVRRLHDIVNEGKLGELLSVQGDLTAFRHYDPTDRIFSRELGGGAMLDLGIYVLSFAVDFLGVPSHLFVRGHRYANGVDSDVEMMLHYDDNTRFGVVTAALNAVGPGRMVLTGTRGWAEVMPRFHHPNELRVHCTGTVPRAIEVPPDGRGYCHELREVTRLMMQGQIESPTMPLNTTLALQELMASGLAQIGVQPAVDSDHLE